MMGSPLRLSRIRTSVKSWCQPCDEIAWRKLHDCLGYMVNLDRDAGTVELAPFRYSEAPAVGPGELLKHN